MTLATTGGSKCGTRLTSADGDITVRAKPWTCSPDFCVIILLPLTVSREFVGHSSGHAPRLIVLWLSST
jgi:hypothetical protein